MKSYSTIGLQYEKSFFISDTHFGHRRILEYEPVNRPFKDVFEMNEQLVSRWNSVVGSNDLVFHLGDFSFSGKEQIRGIVSRLNGKIVLLLGNHDRSKNRDWWISAGFYDVISGPVLLDGKFVLSHEPMGGIEIPEPIPEGKVNLYGHVHGDKLFNTIDFNRMCVCVERWNCTPIEFGFIQEKFVSNDIK